MLLNLDLLFFHILNIYQYGFKTAGASCHKVFSQKSKDINMFVFLASVSLVLFKYYYHIYSHFKGSFIYICSLFLVYILVILFYAFVIFISFCYYYIFLL